MPEPTAELLHSATMTRPRAFREGERARRHPARDLNFNPGADPRGHDRDAAVERTASRVLTLRRAPQQTPRRAASPSSTAAQGPPDAGATITLLAELLIART